MTQAWPLVPSDPVDLHHKGELLLVKILNHHDEVLVRMTRHYSGKLEVVTSSLAASCTSLCLVR